jgi:hypothetical protein
MNRSAARMLMKKLSLSVLLAFSFLAGCSLPGSSSTGDMNGPQAWIEAPLDGSIQPMQPLEIVAHSNEPLGVQEIEFSINGAVVARQNAGDSNRSLYTVHQAWMPSSEGMYRLEVRARNAAGAWGGAAAVVFRVGGTDETPVPTNIPEPTGTPTPTAAPIKFTVIQAAPKLFYHSKSCGPNDPNCQSTCGPSQVQIRVQVSSPELVKNVVMFFSLAGKKSSTGWNEGVSMNPLGNGIYEYKLAGDKVPDAKSFDEATFRYQFVATDDKNNNLARSQVFSDVALAVCP